MKVIKGQNYTVKLNLEKLIKITDNEKVMNNSTQRKLGNNIIRAMRDRIAQGKSPVKGVPRYKPYVLERKGKGYPDVSIVKKNFGGKQVRPVNLELSGEWLSLLTFNEVKGGVSIGWFNPSKKTKALIETHNDGLHPHVPRRQVLPNGPGDDYTVSIKRLIKKVVLERITSIINK